MWALLLLSATLTLKDDVEHFSGKVLETYGTKAECTAEQHRVAVEMEKAYPEDTQFTLACFYKETRVKA